MLSAMSGTLADVPSSLSAAASHAPWSLLGRLALAILQVVL
ncbi:hypothetical protein [Nocardia acidivorans]|nr:hypothetical protein [Nocardia acidivorans]